MKIYELFNVSTSRQTERCQKCLENKELLNFLSPGQGIFIEIKIKSFASIRTRQNKIMKKG